MGHGNNQTPDWKVSGISWKYPTYRNAKIIASESWLWGKREDDGAEGLWRIYDSLYDFTTFIDHHPGGKFWIKATKGTDITEAFEAHHISELPERLISKYKVRNASERRNYKFNFNADGFYKTLKSRVRVKLTQIDYTQCRWTDLYHSLLLLGALFLPIISVRTGSIAFDFAAALSICWLAVASHNYFHRKDNWRMYAFNLALLNFSDWRISHALSHHIYPNSLHDLEMSMFEPFMCWVPNNHYSTKILRIISVVVQPIIYAVVIPVVFSLRVLRSIFYKNVLHWHDAIGFVIPTLMYFASNDRNLNSTLFHWIFIILLTSFIFVLVGINAAHHHTQAYHDGDTYRPGLDWGLFQVDTIIDRCDIKSSPFMVLTNFGEHVLHHLFPTLDHAILPQLNSLLLQTLEEYGAEMREKNWFGQIVGQSRQLVRTVPNPNPPRISR